MKTIFKSPNDSPGFLMWKLSNEWQKQQRQTLAKYQLTHVQFVFLACLQWLRENEDKKHISQNDLAAVAKLDKMVISETVQKLLAKKLINRKKHGDDKRAYIIELTAKGKRLIDVCVPVVEATDHSFFNSNRDNIKLLHNIVQGLKF